MSSMENSSCFGCGFNVVAALQSYLHAKFRFYGLVPEVVMLDGGRTNVHMWRPRIRRRGVKTRDKPLGSIVLLHGFGASAVFQWQDQISKLVALYDVYVPDLVFFGGSYSEREERSDIFQADCMLRALQSLGVQRFDVVGLSYGGFVALRIAHSNPECVRRVVLTDSPGPIFQKTDYEALLQRFKIEDVADLLLPTEPWEVRRLMEVATLRPPPTTNWILRHALQHLFSDMVEEKRQLLGHLNSYMENAASLRVPPIGHETLIVWGECDLVFPLELANRLAEYLGGKARVAMMKNTSHLPNVENARAYNRTILKFLSEPSGGVNQAPSSDLHR